MCSVYFSFQWKPKSTDFHDADKPNLNKKNYNKQQGSKIYFETKNYEKQFENIENINPFLAKALNLYALKTIENQRFSGLKNESIGQKWVIKSPLNLPALTFSWQIRIAIK